MRLIEMTLKLIETDTDTLRLIEMTMQTIILWL